MIIQKEAVYDIQQGYEGLPPPRKLCGKKGLNAFTLAEVLITLGIIGVVAALTLPSLIENIEKIVLKNQIKRNYSLVSQNYMKVIAELGDAITINEGFGYKEFNDAFLANITIINVCAKNALAKGCIKKYEGLNLHSCSGFNETNIYNNQTIYILNDGSFLIPYSMDWRSLWLVDVNGKKGPNKAGFDLFEVVLDAKDNRLRYVGRSCINQSNPPIKGYLDDFANIDKW